MSRLWTVLAHPWHECYLDALPYLAEPGEAIQIVAPEAWKPSEKTEIVFGLAKCMNVWDRALRAANVIPYETENLLAPHVNGHHEHSVHCRSLLGRLWLNYSRRNARVYGDIPMPPRKVSRPLIESDRLARPIDVFFAGSINRRRLEVLSELERVGLRVDVASTRAPVWGPELAAREARAKVVLNMHYYEPGIFEAFRVAPAKARGSLVVTEADEFGESWEWCPHTTFAYENLVDGVLRYCSGAVDPLIRS